MKSRNLFFSFCKVGESQVEGITHGEVLLALSYYCKRQNNQERVGNEPAFKVAVFLVH